MYDNIQKSVNYSRGAPLKLNYLGTKGLGLCLFLDLFRKVSPLLNNNHIFTIYTSLILFLETSEKTSLLFKHILHPYNVLIQEPSSSS